MKRRLKLKSHKRLKKNIVHLKSIQTKTPKKILNNEDRTFILSKGGFWKLKSQQTGNPILMI